MSDRSEHSDAPLPPALEAKLEEQPPEERAELRRTWALSELAREAEEAQEPVDTSDGWRNVVAALEGDENASQQRPSRRSPQPSDTSPRIAPTRRHPERRHPERRHPERRHPERRHPERRVADRASEGQRRKGQARQWLRRGAVVAALALLVGVALVWRLRPVTVRAAAGERATVELPDGSRVALSSDSRLTYQRGLLGWGGGPLQAERNVQLRGEAFFDVAEADQRFTVQTTNARVQVLGTRFNVRVRAEQEARGPARPVTAVVLASGRVRLAATGAPPSQAVTLAPGQTSRVVGASNAPTTPEAASVEAATAWRQGGFAFSGAAFPEIVAEVQRRFAVDVRVATPALLRDSVSLYLPQAASAAGVLRDLCAVQGCRVQRAPSGGLVIEAQGGR